MTNGKERLGQKDDIYFRGDYNLTMSLIITGGSKD